MGYRTSLDLISDPDPGRYLRLVLPALPYTDYLIVNELEAAALTGTPPASSGTGTHWESALGQAERLLESGVQELVAIHFPEGAVAAARSGARIRQGAYRVPEAEVVSTLGAGDAFCAGVLYGLHQGAPLERCLQAGVGLAHCNLAAESATDGAVPLDRLPGGGFAGSSGCLALAGGPSRRVSGLLPWRPWLDDPGGVSGHPAGKERGRRLPGKGVRLSLPPLKCGSPVHRAGRGSCRQGHPW